MPGGGADLISDPEKMLDVKFSEDLHLLVPDIDVEMTTHRSGLCDSAAFENTQDCRNTRKKKHPGK
jgi:hypothetical protein